MAKEFLEVLKDKMDVTGVWEEHYRETLIRRMESMYKTEIIRDYFISDLVINGDKVLVKWNKRHLPLSKEDLKDDYGREQ